MRIVKTSVGKVLVDNDYDVPLLGGSAKKPFNGMPVIYVDRDWNPEIKIDGKMVDRLPFLAEHEAVEREWEDKGDDYASAHSVAEKAENGLVRDAGISPEAYERSYIPDIKMAASKPDKDLKLPPDLIVKPYDHPHSVRQRELLKKVKENGQPDTN